jgi:hypothetical protein
MRYVYYLTFYSYSGKFLELLIKIFKSLFFNVSIIQLPRQQSKVVVIKSPHVFNKSREHFETIVSKKLVYLPLHKNKEVLFHKVLKGIYWSMFGISVKKIKFCKKRIYILKKNSNN